MIKKLKKLTALYIVFGVGVVLGSVIASTVAGLLMLAVLDADQLQRVNEEAERIKNK